MGSGKDQVDRRTNAAQKCCKNVVIFRRYELMEMCCTGHSSSGLHKLNDAACGQEDFLWGRYQVMRLERPILVEIAKQIRSIRSAYIYSVPSYMVFSKTKGGWPSYVAQENFTSLLCSPYTISVRSPREFGTPSRSQRRKRKGPDGEAYELSANQGAQTKGLLVVLGNI